MMRAKEQKKGALVPRLRFPEFRDAGEWEKIKLSTCVQLISGIHLSPSEYGSTGDVPYFSGPSDFTHNISSFNKWSKNLHSVARENDILVTVKGSGVGELWCLKLPRVAIGRQLMAIRAESCVYQFLYQSLGTKNSLFKALGSGNLIPGLSRNDILDMKFCFPSLSEQQRIADCLSSLDERITAESSKLDTLKDHKKGLLKQLFPAEGETLPRLRFPEFRDAGEWEKPSIKNVGLLKNGYAFKSQNYAEEGKYKIITIANVKSGKFNIDNANKISQLPNDIQAHQILKSGDILISMTGNVGRVCRVDGENYLLNQRVGKIVPAKIHDMFLYHSLQQESFLQSMTLKAAGGAQGNLSVSAIQDHKIQIPEQIEEQQKIADCLSSLDELITAQAQKIDLLKTHKKGLMQQLFPVIDEAKA